MPQVVVPVMNCKYEIFVILRISFLAINVANKSIQKSSLDCTQYTPKNFNFEYNEYKFIGFENYNIRNNFSHNPFLTEKCISYTLLHTQVLANLYKYIQTSHIFFFSNNKIRQTTKKYVIYYEWCFKGRQLLTRQYLLVER